MQAGFTTYMDQGIMQIDSNIKTAAPAFRQTYAGPYTNDGNTAFIGTWYQFTIEVPSDAKYLFFSSSVDRSIGLMKKSGTSHTSGLLLRELLKSTNSRMHHLKHLTIGQDFRSSTPLAL
jgi:hypothetical protein